MRKFIVLLLLFSSFNAVAQEEIQTGEASFYADRLEGKRTASGDVFSQSELTAAHKTLPFGTKIKVTNLANNKFVIVEVNDRGPFTPQRILDLSKAAAQKLGFIDLGVTTVSIEVIEDAP